MPVIVAVMFREADWPQLLRLCDELQDTHAEGEAQARQHISAHRALGHQVVEVLLKPVHIRRWARGRRRKIKANERARLAIAIAHALDAGGEKPPRVS